MVRRARAAPPPLDSPALRSRDAGRDALGRGAWDEARVHLQASIADGEPADGRVERWRARLAPWTEQTREFRNEGFYERFPAKGQVERVTRIHRELGRIAGVAARGKQ